MSDLEYEVKELMEKYGIKAILETIAYYCSEPKL